VENKHCTHLRTQKAARQENSRTARVVAGRVHDADLTGCFLKLTVLHSDNELKRAGLAFTR
jgi:hypothetical protein